MKLCSLIPNFYMHVLCICEQFIFFHDWSTYFAGYYILIRWECRLYIARQLGFPILLMPRRRSVPKRSVPNIVEFFIG
jgi:hypothetical protein